MKKLKKHTYLVYITAIALIISGCGTASKNTTSIPKEPIQKVEGNPYLIDIHH